MNDETESIRREMIEAGVPAQYLVTAEQVWTTERLCEEFDVIGFRAPFVVVIRKADGVKGSLMFTHQPRFYFNWKEDGK